VASIFFCAGLHILQVLAETDFLRIFMKRFHTNCENIVFMDQSGIIYFGIVYKGIL